MKFLVLLFLLCNSAYAHKHHHQMEASEKVSDHSLYILKDEWTTKEGKKFQLEQMKGKPALVLMAYTKCQTACPIIIQDVKNILKKLPKDKQNIDVVMISFDSEKETAKSLTDFYKLRGLSDNWTLLTGSAHSVSTIAAVLGVSYKKLPDGEYIHSNSIYFMDKQGIIQGKQDGIAKVDDKFVKILQEKL